MAKLVIVPTPIGNLGDISTRARDMLCRCSCILCEDTRVGRKLLSHIGATTKLLSYREYNEDQQIKKIINLILDGHDVCLTCDAGTPGISDPGFRIVRACRKHAIPVEALPGPCAAITALSAAGLPSDGFLFLGFLSNKSSARQKALHRWKDFDYTIIFYESCHRIMKFLDDLHAVVGGTRVVCVAKEISKLHETFFVGPLARVILDIKSSVIKGEYTIIVAPATFDI